MATRQNANQHPAKDVISRNFNYLRDIPHPSEEYTAYEAPKGVRNHKLKFIQTSIIHPVDSTNDKHESHIYRTDPRAYQDIQAEKENRDLLPCGHSGFVNERDTTGFGCGYEYCDAVYTREEVEDLDL